MLLEPVGRKADIDTLDFEPITIPVVGYTLTDKAEVIEQFDFRPVINFGALAEVMRKMTGAPRGPLGELIVRSQACLEFVAGCLMEGHAEPFMTYIARSDLAIDAETIGAVFTALAEAYAARPTTPSGSSANGRTSARRTSGGASGAKGAKRSQKRTAA